MNTKGNKCDSLVRTYIISTENFYRREQVWVCGPLYLEVWIWRELSYYDKAGKSAMLCLNKGVCAEHSFLREPTRLASRGCLYDQPTVTFRGAEWLMSFRGSQHFTCAHTMVQGNQAHPRTPQ